MPIPYEQPTPGQGRISPKSGLSQLVGASGHCFGLMRPSTTMKTGWSKDAANRREFLRGGLRYALLTAVGAVSATLVKRSVGQLAGQTCVNQGICPGCTAFTDCGLPQALSAKQYQREAPRPPRDELSRRIPAPKPESVGTFHPLAQKRNQT